MVNSGVDRERETAFNYDHPKLTSLLGEVIRKQVKPDAWSWLEEKIRAANELSSFNTTFASIPRKTGKLPLDLSLQEEQAIKELLPGFTIKHWRVDRLARVWLLMHLDPSDKEKYFRTIEQLFLAAEMNELVALYSSLPVLAYPEMWKKRCAEGIRSNIADVLESIMYDNPFPAKYLPEAAWNQLVLKAFFTEKNINRIMGADERSNQELANILSDYAHERWAAHRPVHPQLWRFVSKHLNERIFPDIQRLAASQNKTEREAAALVCHETNYAPAKKMLNEDPESKKAIESGALTWESF
jgi:hypothetical protein